MPGSIYVSEQGRTLLEVARQNVHQRLGARKSGFLAPLGMTALGQYLHSRRLSAAGRKCSPHRLFAAGCKYSPHP